MLDMIFHYKIKSYKYKNQTPLLLFYSEFKKMYLYTNSIMIIFYLNIPKLYNLLFRTDMYR